MSMSWFNSWLLNNNFSPATADTLTTTATLAVILIATIIVMYIVRGTLLKVILRWFNTNKYKWDDPLLHHNVFPKLSWFIPVALITLSLDTFLDQSGSLYLFSKRIVMSGFVIVAVISLTAILSALNDIYTKIRKNRRYALRGYTDAGKIVIYIFGGIFIISIFTGKSPWGVLSILGGLTAVTLLIFKDSILGFVASLQLTSSDALRIGDWIEMKKFGADGEVISMSIHSIEVQNWDKTITTIPPYSLVSSSFKNWRGMSESGGRRIKRSLLIDIQSIRFCDDEMMEKFTKIDLLEDYISAKKAEITTHNSERGTDTSLLINGRRQTNIGVFRAYIIAYLKNNPEVVQSMTFLVRQLAPDENGLPIQIYVFSRDQAWANYEAIQADIFDHLIAATKEFDLTLFQNPSGNDLKSVLCKQ